MDDNYIKKEEEKRTPEYINKRARISSLILSSDNPKSIVDTLSADELTNLDKEVYLLKVPGYINMYDYILKSHPENLGSLPKENERDYEIIMRRYDFMAQAITTKHRDENEPELALVFLLNNGCLLDTMDNDFLLTNMPDGTKVVDYVIAHNIPFSIKNNIKLIEYLLEKGEYELINKGGKKEFYQEILPNGKSVFEELVSRGAIPTIKFVTFDCYDSGYGLDEEINGKKVIEILIDNNVNFRVMFSPTLFIDSLITKERYDREEMEKTIVELARYGKLYVIENLSPEFQDYKININGVKIQFKKFYNLITNNVPLTMDTHNALKLVKRHVDFGGYIDFTESNVETIIKSVPVEYLTKVGKTGASIIREIVYYYVISLSSLDDKKEERYNYFIWLLKQNNKLTEEVSRELSIFNIYFESNGYNIKFGINNNNYFRNELKDEKNFEQKVEQNVSEKLQKQIDWFRKSYKDSASEEIIQRIIDLSIKYADTNEELAIQDLYALNLTKLHNPDFSLISKQTSSAYFRHPNKYNRGAMSVGLNCNDIDLYHEWGHLIEDIFEVNKYIYNFKLPTLEQIKDSSEFLLSFAKKINNELLKAIPNEKLEKEYYDLIDKKYGSLENYKKVLRQEIEDNLSNGDYLQELIETGWYSEKCLNQVNDISIKMRNGETKDDFYHEFLDHYVESRIRVDKKIYKSEVTDLKYGELLMYENFIDSYYRGYLREAIDKLAESGIEMSYHSTHNIEYYEDDDMVYSELFANYVGLRKSPNGKMYIDNLKKSFGNIISELETKYEKAFETHALDELRTLLGGGVL